MPPNAMSDLSNQERKAWLAGWRRYADLADIKAFAEAEKGLSIEAEQLARHGLTSASPEAQLLAERWMSALEKHSLIASLTQVHQRDPVLAVKVAGNVRKNGERKFLHAAVRLRMRSCGLGPLLREVRNLLDQGIGPKSDQAERAAAFYLKYCAGQYIRDPVGFAELIAQYPDTADVEADGSQAEWSFIAQCGAY